ncbi:SlyX family protein [Marinomonas sp. 15G1-11]|uniref:SlyX family protein n=1 Tax=Marinomonas phaeophyticola TaxID=3004091 RepID=A0ABT4JTK3_9GAMM|nr:SlyX family protein [Marinomonas sp. 15G1-11]MCZ2721687.1 SlyX family protein [Marinomonas sp. 15G1-11]
MNTTDNNPRIDDIEFKLQYQEDLIETLNTALSKQQREIMRLEEKLILVVKMVESYRSQQSITENEQPPHY